jgi:ferredoxin
MTDQRIRVDWPLCTARGVCHELLPELIAIDDWGYPLMSRDPVPPELAGLARTAVRLCPRLALRLVRDVGR